jgi:hypothetical protein
VCDCSNSFKEGRTDVENTWRLHLLQGKLWPAFLSDSQGVLFIDFLLGQRTNNAVYYSKLLKDRVKPAFRSKRRGRSVKRRLSPQDKARPYTAAVTTGTFEKCTGTYCHTPPTVLTWRQAIFTCSVHLKRS